MCVRVCVCGGRQDCTFLDYISLKERVLISITATLLDSKINRIFLSLWCVLDSRFTRTITAQNQGSSSFISNVLTDTMVAEG